MTAAPQVAVDQGHTLEWDPPFGLTRAHRWTCTVCGNAVIDYCGNVYGSATEQPCTEGGAS